MKTLKTLLAILAVALFAAVPAGAAGFATQVGGISLAVTLTGTSTSGPAEVVWTTPANFTPDFIECVNELDGDPDIYRWYVGMGNNTSIKVAQATGIVTYVSTAGSACGFDTGTAGTIKIAAACQQASEAYSCIAIRYSK